MHQMNALSARTHEPRHFRAISPPGDTDSASVETYFAQPCPTCGRRLLVLVEHLGRKVSCSHCGRVLVARDTSSDVHGDQGELNNSLLARANRLLAAFS